MKKINLWESAMDVLREKLRTKNQSEIAKDLGVAPSTVGRWLENERGQDRPNVKYLELIFSTYRLTFREVLMQSLPSDQAETILQAMDEKLESLIKVCEILNRNDKNTAKLLGEIDFLSEEKMPK